MTDEPPKLHSVIMHWNGPAVVLERFWEYLTEEEEYRAPMLFLEQPDFGFFFDCPPMEHFENIEDVSLPEDDDSIIVRALWYRDPCWAEEAARWCFLREVKRRGIDSPELPPLRHDADRSFRREQPVRAFEQRG